MVFNGMVLIIIRNVDSLGSTLIRYTVQDLHSQREYFKFPELYLIRALEPGAILFILTGQSVWWQNPFYCRPKRQTNVQCWTSTSNNEVSSQYRLEMIIF